MLNKTVNNVTSSAAMRIPTVDVRAYTDYRAFLMAYAQKAKARNPRWSLGSWAKALGLADATSIAKILKGARKPGPDITDRLIRFFTLSTEDAAYFQDLIDLDRFKRDPKLTSLLLKKMDRNRAERSITTLDLQLFETISNWYCLAIREMARMDGFVEDAQWLSKRLRFSVTPEQTEQAIRLLLSVGLLKRDENGRLRAASPSFRTPDGMFLAGRRYHAAMLGHAREALEEVPNEEREFRTLAIPVRFSNVAKAKEMLREFAVKFEAALEEESGDAVYQLQLQFFPLTHRVESEEDTTQDTIENSEEAVS